MKYLKSYKVFESSYSIEEYIDSLSDELGNYNLSPVQIRELINRLDIDDYIERGVSPRDVVIELNNDMEFNKGGFPSHMTSKPQQSTIKYI